MAGFKRLAAEIGARAALEASLSVLVVVPPCYFSILHALTGFPDGCMAAVLWLLLFVARTAAGARLLPGRFRRVWAEAESWIHQIA